MASREATGNLILCVGYDIAECPPQRWNPKHDKKIVHIDFSFAEVYADYKPEVEVIGDISGTLWELNRQLHNERLKFDTKWYAAVRRRIIRELSVVEVPVDPSVNRRLIEKLDEFWRVER